MEIDKIVGGFIRKTAPEGLTRMMSHIASAANDAGATAAIRSSRSTPTPRKASPAPAIGPAVASRSSDSNRLSSQELLSKSKPRQRAISTKQSSTASFPDLASFVDDTLAKINPIMLRLAGTTLEDICPITLTDYPCHFSLRGLCPLKHACNLFAREGSCIPKVIKTGKYKTEPSFRIDKNCQFDLHIQGACLEELKGENCANVFVYGHDRVVYHTGSSEFARYQVLWEATKIMEEANKALRCGRYPDGD